MPFGIQIGKGKSTVADPLLPPDDPGLESRPSPAPKKAIICEFCECVLAPSGDYVSLSAKAKALRAQEETIAGLQGQVSSVLAERDEARRELTDAQAQITALQREKADAQSRGFWKREAF